MRNLMILAAFGAVACAKGAEGDACTVDADCGDGLACDVPTTTTATDAEGTCVATATTTMTETMTETMTTEEPTTTP